MATWKTLDDSRKCTSCAKAYTDPRVLACGHKFCFKCIETWSNDPSGRQLKELVCPLCRTPYTLPLSPPVSSSALDDLKRDFVKFSQMILTKLKGLVYFV